MDSSLKKSKKINKSMKVKKQIPDQKFRAQISQEPNDLDRCSLRIGKCATEFKSSISLPIQTEAATNSQNRNILIDPPAQCGHNYELSGKYHGVENISLSDKKKIPSREVSEDIKDIAVMLSQTSHIQGIHEIHIYFIPPCLNFDYWQFN